MIGVSAAPEELPQNGTKFHTYPNYNIIRRYKKVM